MKRALPLFALLFISSLLRTAHADPADPDPKQASQTRQVPAFHGVELAGTLGVDVGAGKPGSVELVGDPDLFDKVLTTVKDGVLVIDTRFPNDHREHHVRALVSAPDVTSLVVSGTGSIKATGIANATLALNLIGTGSVSASGTTGALRVDVGGTGSVSAKDLVAKSALVSMAGTGSATLDATDSVDATLSGTGSINIHGNPARVRKSKTGVGSIHIR